MVKIVRNARVTTGSKSFKFFFSSTNTLFIRRLYWCLSYWCEWDCSVCYSKLIFYTFHLARQQMKRLLRCTINTRLSAPNDFSLITLTLKRKAKACSDSSLLVGFQPWHNIQLSWLTPLIRKVQGDCAIRKKILIRLIVCFLILSEFMAPPQTIATTPAGGSHRVENGSRRWRCGQRIWPQLGVYCAQTDWTRMMMQWIAATREAWKSALTAGIKTPYGWVLFVDVGGNTATVGPSFPHPTSEAVSISSQAVCTQSGRLAVHCRPHDCHHSFYELFYFFTAALI